MGDGIETLLRAIPESDQHCNLKRAEIRRWHQSCGVKVLNSKSEDIVASILNDESLWNGYKINKFDFGQRVLNDTKGIMNDYDHYRLACLLCSKEKIREYFIQRGQELNRSIEDLVTRPFGRLARTKLENFWSHYANIVDVNDPSPVIVESFKKMMSAKGLSSDNQNDIWKYGFLCAKEVGSRDAMDFFVNNLIKGKKEEKDMFLINTIAKTMFSTVNVYPDNQTLEFCIENLSPDKYKILMNQEVKARGCLTIFKRLVDINSYDRIKQLASCLTSNDISEMDYSDLLYNIVSPGVFIPEELMQSRIDLFKWLWKSENFEVQRLGYLNNLNKICALTVIRQLIEINELSAYKMVIGDAKPEQIKKALLKGGNHICGSLYQKNKRVLLSDLLCYIENGGRFLSNLDSVVRNHLINSLEKNRSLCPEKAFEFYTKGQREELLKYVESVVETKRGHNQLLYDIDLLVYHSFRNMLEGKFKFEEISDLDKGISSSLSEVQQQSSCAVRTRNRRK